MASKVLYNGSAIATPGVYPTVEAGELSPLSVASTNVIAILGEAAGGTPISSSMTYDEVFEASVFTGSIAQKLRRTFQSGDLRDAALYAAGKVTASRMICMKVNQDTAASVTWPGDDGDVFTATAKGAGAVGNNLRLAMGGGANTVDIALTGPSSVTSGLSQTGVGSQAAFSMTYDDGADNYGWTTVRAAVTRTALLGLATRDFTAPGGVTIANFAGPATATITITGADAADVGKVIRVYGLSGSALTYEDYAIAAAGNSTRVTTTSWDSSGIMGMALFEADGVEPAVLVGTSIAIDETGGGTAVGTIAAAAGSIGIARFYLAPVASGTKISAVASGADTSAIRIFGRNQNGVLSGVSLTLSGTTPVETAALGFVSLEAVCAPSLGGVTVTLAAEPFYALFSTYERVSELVEYVDGLYGSLGVTIAMVDQTASGALCTTLDATDGYSGNLTTARSFYRSLDQALAILNQSSSPVTAELVDYVANVWTATDSAAPGTHVFTCTPDGETGVNTVAGTTAAAVNFLNRHPNTRFWVSAVATSSTLATITSKVVGQFALTPVTATTTTETVAMDGQHRMDDGASMTSLAFTSGAASTATTNDYVTALEKLRDFDCDSIVVLSSSSAVHDALISHLEYRAGRGGSESQGFVGILNTAGDDVPTKTELRTDIRSLNTRHLTVWGQALSWINEDQNGRSALEEFLPHIACIVPAVLQARANIGVPISRKELSSIGIDAVRSDTSWDPREDSDEMLDYGLTFAEMVPQTGAIRLVRHVTAHLTDDNIAFVNGSVNRLVNYVVRTFRRDMESFLAQPGTVKTVNNVRSYAIRRLDRFVRDEVLVSWDSLSLSLELDVLSIGVAISPVVDINFILPTFYLKAANITV